MPGFAYNGIHFVSWRSDEYASEESAAALRELAATTANWAGLLTTWYQAGAAAVTIGPNPEKTPSDAALACAVERMHALGLKVMLKPHVDALDGAWRGTFQPADVDRWFRSYARFAAHYAELAESLGVDGLIAGTEFVRLTGKPFRRRWTEIICDIRTRFGGLVTYAANAASAGDEFAKVSFWDVLDVIGLDAYFRVTRAQPARDQTLRPKDERVSLLNGGAQPGLVRSRVTDGWTPHMPRIQRLAEQLEKPVLFTEIGYRSVSQADREPWNWTSEGTPDADCQAECYRAFFEAWKPHASWMQGTFWWNWPAGPANPLDSGYSPRRKPAARVLAECFELSPEAAHARRLEELKRLVEAGEYDVDAIAISRALLQHHLRSNE